jgi:hypothetical protein
MSGSCRHLDSGLDDQETALDADIETGKPLAKASELEGVQSDRAEETFSAVDDLATFSFTPDEVPAATTAPDAAPGIGTEVDSILDSSLQMSRNEFHLELLHEAIDTSYTEVQQSEAWSSDAFSQYQDAMLNNLAPEVDELHNCVAYGRPYDLSRIDYNHSAMGSVVSPLFETAARINTELGFDSPEKISHFWEKAIEQVNRLEDWRRMQGIEWRDLPPETAETLRTYLQVLEAGAASELPKIDPQPLATYPDLVDLVAEIHAEHNAPFNRPERRQGPSFSERTLATATSLLGAEFVPGSLTELGQGSEGMIFRAVTADGREVAIKAKNPGTEYVNRTAEVVAGLRLSSADVTPLIPYAEDRGMAISPYIPNSFTMAALADALNSPEKVATPAINNFLDRYRSENPGDPDLSGLRQTVLQTGAEMSRARLSDPLTANPINFMVTGFNAGRIELVCIDPR